MRTSEERIAALHERANKLKREREKRQSIGWGSLSFVLLVTLIVMNLHMDKLSHTFIDEQFAGTSLISDSRGEIVLVAVIAFMAGVVITTLIRKSRNKNQHKQ